MKKKFMLWWADFIEGCAIRNLDGTTEKQIALHKIQKWAEGLREEFNS